MSAKPAGNAIGDGLYLIVAGPNSEELELSILVQRQAALAWPRLIQGRFAKGCALGA
jgi:hypothetical protein